MTTDRGRNEPSTATAADTVALDEDHVFAALDSFPAGLSHDEAHRRFLRCGPNEVPRQRSPHPLRLLFAQATHTLALLLWAGAGLAFVAGLPQLGWTVLAIVAVNAVFSFWQEFRASRLVETLQARLPVAVRVRRGGAEQRIRARDLVPGDVLIIRRGDRVAADARLMRAIDLRLDYSALTGEAEPVARDASPARPAPLAEAPNCVLSGTTVIEGSGEAVVFATGRATAFGRVAELAERVYWGQSPLQRELAAVARIIAAVAIAVGAAFFLAGDLSQRLSTEDAFIFGVGMLVALVPEGLLPTVTLSLALAVQRMGRHNAIVKRLSSVETLGCTSVICTDKTGTITMNEMTAREVWTADAHYDVSGRGYGLRGGVRTADDSAGDDQASLELLLRCAVLCNDGVPPRTHRRAVELGDPLDEALLVLAIKGGLDPDRERLEWRRMKEFPFHAERRRMSTLHERRGELRLFVKGGPVETLACCRDELGGGAVRLLDRNRRAELKRRTNEMSDRGLRVLAFALRDVSGPPPPDADTAERDLVLLGLVGLENPLRPDVPDAVARCHAAGIQVVMLTGDYPHTALVVGNQAGIAPPHADVVTGAQIDVLSDEALTRMLEERQPSVFARVAPEHKLRLVQAYQRLGHVVAVTGDGVNDAPALKAAEIGVAMGRTGTDVAREAADMVLMDDHFGTIVRAVEEGRAVYGNIRKFLTYILTSNVPEAVPFILFVLAGVPLPLTILQILLVDLGTDLLPAIALGVEPPGRGAMERPPRARSERIVTPALLVRALGFLGLLAAGLSLAGYFYVQHDLSRHWLRDLLDEGPLYRQATTMTLAGIVACQAANAFACRSDRESTLGRALLANRALLWAVAAEIALLAFLIGLPPMRDVFDLEPISPKYWPVLAAMSAVFLLLEEARKLAARAATKRRAES